jgi:hypothetical protein
MFLIPTHVRHVSQEAPKSQTFGIGGAWRTTFQPFEFIEFPAPSAAKTAAPGATGTAGLMTIWSYSNTRKSKAYDTRH